MPHNQIGANLGPRRERLEKCLGAPNLVLERPAAVIRLWRGTSPNAICKSFDAARRFARPFGNERASPAMPLDQPPCDMAELGREVFVNKQDMHGAFID